MLGDSDPWSGRMAVVLFECPLDDVTLGNIHELRQLRLEVLRKQIYDVDAVLLKLLEQGSLEQDELEPFRVVVLEELKNKCVELEKRISQPETLYFDELELYLDVLNTQ